MNCAISVPNLPMKVFLFGYSKDDGSTWKFFRIDSTYRDVSITR